MITLPFTKMHGLGNDFVFVDADRIPPEWSLEKLATVLCDRHFGVGGDGLIMAQAPSDPARFDIKFVYLNSDGSWAEMCGNGIRCFARYARDKGLVSKDAFSVETLAGEIRPQINEDGTVTVDMGAPVFEAANVPFAANGVSGFDPAFVRNYPLPVDGQTVPVTALSMGNPHALIFQEDLPDPLNPAVFGPAVEMHPAFPNKTNVEFLEVLDPHTLKATVWERGCGFTLACGTGACASAVGGIRLEKVNNPVTVQLPGGDLLITWDPDENQGHVLMSGPATYAFTGQFWLNPEQVAGTGAA